MQTLQIRKLDSTRHEIRRHLWRHVSIKYSPIQNALTIWIGSSRPEVVQLRPCWLAAQGTSRLHQPRWSQLWTWGWRRRGVHPMWRVTLSHHRCSAPSSTPGRRRVWTYSVGPPLSGMTWLWRAIHRRIELVLNDTTFRYMFWVHLCSWLEKCDWSWRTTGVSKWC